MASNTYRLVKAIDFGTTYSGWTFSFKYEYKADPTKITGRKWSGGQFVSMKAPTTVLIKPDGKTLNSFDYDAETIYAELATENDYKKWYFFRPFKMLMHGRKSRPCSQNQFPTLKFIVRNLPVPFDRNMNLEDETQKSLPAMTVFSLVIRHLKEDMLKISTDRLISSHLREDEIMWILTMPAIWNNAAKQFMRAAAVKAGIKNENVKIALEPETASIFRRLLPAEMLQGGGMAYFKTSSKYMVLDAGGGTVDITVHEVMPGGKLKEIHKSTGGAGGGTQVDKAFKQLIISLVGNPVFCRFQTESKEDCLDVFREFEIKKRDKYLQKTTNK